MRGGRNEDGRSLLVKYPVIIFSCAILSVLLFLMVVFLSVSILLMITGQVGHTEGGFFGSVVKPFSGGIQSILGDLKGGYTTDASEAVRGIGLKEFDDKFSFSIPAKVNILIVGQKSANMYLSEKLVGILDKVYSVHQPYILSTGEKTSFNYPMTYEVHVTDMLVQTEIEQIMLKLMRQDTELDAGNDGKMFIAVEKFEKYLGEILQKLKLSDGEYSKKHSLFSPFTIIIMETSLEMELAKLGSDGYFYRSNEGEPTQTFQSSQNFLLMDISAEKCTFGSLFGEGTFIGSELLLKDIGSHISSKQQLIAQMFYVNRVASIVVSAIQRVFLPDIEYKMVLQSEKVFIPIVVLRNHKHFDPFHTTGDMGEFQIDIELVKREAMKLKFPRQELQISQGVFDISDHPDLSVSIWDSIKTYSMLDFGRTDGEDKNEEEEEGLEDLILKKKSTVILNSEELEHLLLESTDDIIRIFLEKENLKGDAAQQTYSGLEFVNIDPLGAKEREKRTENDGDYGMDAYDASVRILPVFVLSLADIPPGLLFENHHIMKARKDMVLVIQPVDQSVMVPFHTQGKQKYLDASSPTRSIVAGIARSLQGVLPPHLRYSPVHKRKEYEYTWLNGMTPFGDFSKSAVLGDIIVGVSTRNCILSMVNGAVHETKEALVQMREFSRKYVYDVHGRRVSTSFLSVISSSKEYIKNNFKMGFTLNPFSQGDRDFRDDRKRAMRDILGFVTMEEMSSEFLEIENDFSILRDRLLDSKASHDILRDKARELLTKTRKFRNFVNMKVTEAEEILECCRMDYYTSKFIDLKKVKR